MSISTRTKRFYWGIWKFS